MEKMPYRRAGRARQRGGHGPSTETVVSTDWRSGLPMLRGRQVTLRELRASDAPSLFALLTTEEVSRFISPPPTHGRRLRAVHRVDAPSARGRHAMPASRSRSTGFDTAIGIFQVRELEPGFGTAEWGFAIGSAFWGTGVFQDGAELVLDFAFDTIGVHRLEARAAVQNGRGNGALQKIGAVQEGRAAQVVPQERRVSRPGALRHARHRLAWLACDDCGVSRPRALIIDPPALKAGRSLLLVVGRPHVPALAFFAHRGPRAHRRSSSRAASTAVSMKRRRDGATRSLANCSGRIRPFAACCGERST